MDDDDSWMKFSSDEESIYNPPSLYMLALQVSGAAQYLGADLGLLPKSILDDILVVDDTLQLRSIAMSRCDFKDFDNMIPSYKREANWRSATAYKHPRPVSDILYNMKHLLPCIHRSDMPRVPNCRCEEIIYIAILLSKRVGCGDHFLLQSLGLVGESLLVNYKQVIENRFNRTMKWGIKIRRTYGYYVYEKDLRAKLNY